MINKHIKYLGLSTRYHSKNKEKEWKHIKTFGGKLENLLWDNTSKKSNYGVRLINEAWCADITYL